LVHGRAIRPDGAQNHAVSGQAAVCDAYARGETDEFIEPTLVGAEARIRPGDSVIAFNFRPDRMRQLTRALAEPGFGGGGEEAPLRGERRALVPSPRDVPTYDHKPQMSAAAATEAFLEAWRDEQPHFGIINFANADMVGHTGVIPAAVAAVEAVDECLCR